MDHFCPKTYSFISYWNNYVAWYWLLSTAKKLIWWRLSSAQVYGYKNKYAEEDFVTCTLSIIHSFLTSTLSTLWPGLMEHHQRGDSQNGKARRLKLSDASMACLLDKKGTALINSRGYSELCKVKTSKFQA